MKIKKVKVGSYAFYLSVFFLKRLFLQSKEKEKKILVYPIWDIYPNTFRPRPILLWKKSVMSALIHSTPKFYSLPPM